MRNINTIDGIKKRYMKDVEYWAEKYDRASVDVFAFSSMLSTLSTQYVSSVDGNYLVEEINRKRDEDYEMQMVKYREDLFTLDSLRQIRDSSISSLDGWMEVSSLKRRQLVTATAELETIDRDYRDSEEQIEVCIRQIREIREERQRDTTDLFIQSSLLRKSEIDLENYLTGILDSINNQEWSAYEYRQTFCQELSINYQQKYHSLVLGAVQYASTQNGLNAAFGGVPVAPIPINLNTVQLSNAYLSLTTLNTFINSFDTLFTQYNMQSSNIAAMSTTVGYEYIYWDNFQQSSVALISENTPYVQELVSTSVGVFQSSAQAFTDASGVVYSKIEKITEVKNTVYQTYSTFFTPAQMAAQDDTISSFIIQGMEQAAALLQAGT
jgi:hypothetical protein